MSDVGDEIIGNRDTESPEEVPGEDKPVLVATAETPSPAESPDLLLPGHTGEKKEEAEENTATVIVNLDEDEEAEKTNAVTTHHSKKEAEGIDTNQDVEFRPQDGPKGEAFSKEEPVQGDGK